VEEKIGFTKVINDILKDDETLKDVIPMNPESDDLFHCMEDGTVLCKLIN
jgi:hypothetical protein